MKTYVHLIEFFLKREMFHIKLIEKVKTHILWSVTPFSENRFVYEIYGKIWWSRTGHR